MDANRFDSLTRAPNGRSRRRLLAILSGAAVAIGSLTPLAGAKKKRKKKRNTCAATPCPDCPVCPPPTTCAKTCPNTCGQCLTRPEAPLLCGDGITTDCATACSSDGDCSGSIYPTCIAHIVLRESGDVTDVCGGAGLAGAFCVSIIPCA